MAPGTQETIRHLRRSLAWMDLVLANLQEGVLVVDSASRVVFANDAFAALIRKPRVSLVGQPVTDVLSLEQNGRPVSRKRLKTGTLPAGPFCLAVGTSQHWVEVTVASIASLKQGVWVVRDITTQHAMDEELANRNRELEVMNRAMIGRELKMVELKTRLERKAREPKR